MLARGNAAFAVSVALLTGCSGSHSATFSAAEVRDALRAQGFDVEVLPEDEQDRTIMSVLRAFTGDELSGVEDVVGGKPPASTLPTRNATIEAWIFSRDQGGPGVTSCGQVAPGAVCVARRNVEVIVGNRRERAARNALKKLD